MKISSIGYHLRRGTFLQAAKNKIARLFGAVPEPVITRWNIASESDAIIFLAARSAEIASQNPGKKIVLIAEPGQNADAFLEKCKAKNITPEIIGLHQLSKLNSES